MSLTTNRWQLDTCDCILEFVWDDSLSPKDRTYFVSKIIRACSAHQSLASKEIHYDTVLAENRNKNDVYTVLESDYPNLFETVIIEGESITKLKNGAFSFSFDKNRKLIAVIEGLTILQKTELQTKINTKLGIGKVEIL